MTTTTTDTAAAVREMLDAFIQREKAMLPHTVRDIARDYMLKARDSVTDRFVDGLILNNSIVNQYTYYFSCLAISDCIHGNVDLDKNEFVACRWRELDPGTRETIVQREKAFTEELPHVLPAFRYIHRSVELAAKADASYDIGNDLQ